MSEKLIKTAEQLLSSAGININGDNPWDIRLKNEEFYNRVLTQGSLGLGESYMDGWWECDRLDQFFDRLLSAKLDRKVKNNLALLGRLILAQIFNLQSKSRAFNIGEAHYDTGNDLFEAMLDKRMVYTCGYWKDTDNLNDSQEAKLDLVCKKIGLKPGDKVLDIGCGWGSFLKFAAEKYQIQGVGVTVSKEQIELAKKNCQGLPIEIRLQDYRDINEKFDHIVSLGMFEHVGSKNYRTYMKVIHKNLKDSGLFLLHTIGGLRSVRGTDAWINKYIFPDGQLPSISQIGKSIEDLFVMEDWHSFGTDYDKTLMAWHQNFNTHWDQLKQNYNDRFFRMWNYYLLCCAGSFRARKNQLWQVVLSKNGVSGGYKSIR